MQVQTEEDVITRFLERKFRASRSFSTKSSYRVALRRFIEFLRMRYPKCNQCKSNLVTVYISDTSDDHKPKKAIGKLCVNCDGVRDSTEFFNELKRKIQERFVKKEKEKEKSNPGYDPTKQVCHYCGHSRYSTKYHPQRKVRDERDDDSIRVRWENPAFEYKCKKCKRTWRKGLPMRYF